MAADFSFKPTNVTSLLQRLPAETTIQIVSETTSSTSSSPTLPSPLPQSSHEVEKKMIDQHNAIYAASLDQGASGAAAFEEDLVRSHEEEPSVGRNKNQRKTGPLNFGVQMATLDLPFIATSWPILCQERTTKKGATFGRGALQGLLHLGC